MPTAIDAKTLWEFDNLDKRLRALDGQLAKVIEVASGEHAQKAASEVKVKVAQQLHNAAAAFLKAAGVDADSPVLGPKATNTDVAVLTTQLLAGFDSYRDRHVEKRYGGMFWLVQEVGGDIEYVPVSMKAEGPDAE